MEKILNEILNQLKNVNNRLDKLDEGQKLIKTQLKEHGDVLSALKTNAEFHKSDIDNLTHSVAELSGDVKSIKSAVVKGEKAYEYLENFTRFSSLDK